MWGRTEQGRRGGRRGGGSIVAMRKQSNTNWSHSRGTAGAHRGDRLGGPTAMGGGSQSEMETLELGWSTEDGRGRTDGGLLQHGGIPTCFQRGRRYRSGAITPAAAAATPKFQRPGGAR